MNDMVTMDSFIDHVKEALEINDIEIAPATLFRELPNWSSMNALILIAMFETEFDVTLTGDDLRNSNTVQDLYDLL